MAQLASASGLGPEGPVFESQYPDSEADDSSRIIRFFCPLQPGTSNLSTIFCLGKKPAKYVGKNGTKNKVGPSSGVKTIYVPKGCKAAYEKAWAELVNDGWTIQESNEQLDH